MNKMRIVTTLTTVILALLGAGVWWLFTSDRLTYNSDPVSRPNSSLVCGADTVDRYNDAMFYAVREGSSDLTIDGESLNNLVVEIKNKVGYKNDPTCQTILFWTAVQNDDYSAAKDAYDSIKTMHDRGAFADSNIRSNQPLFTYESYLLQLSGSSASQVEVNVGG